MENILSLIFHHNVTTSPISLIFLRCSLILLIPMFILTFLNFFYLEENNSTNKLPLPLPPGPKPWPLFGSLPTMLQKKPVFRWLDRLMEVLDTEIACIRLGYIHVVVVSCPKISSQILRQQTSVFASRPLTMCTQIATNGYLSAALVPHGEQWKKMKKVIVTELLSPAKHNFFYDKRLEEADYLVRHLYKQCTTNSYNCGGLDVNVRYLSRHYCGNLIRKIVFKMRSFREIHEDCGMASFEDEEHIDAIFKMLEHTYAFCVSDYLPFLKGYDLDGHENVVSKATEKLRKYQDPLIEKRIKSWSINGNTNKVEDLLDMFITLKDVNGNFLLSKQEIQAQIIEIMMAVVDNPSNAVEWALAEMICQPKILVKAEEELDKVVGKERLVMESDFSELNYIKACIREAFRLHPISAFNLPHVSMADARVGNYFIPKGSHILLSRMGLGRNPKVWDDPKKFEPERHLKDYEPITLTEPNLRFISFGTGSRGCPGVAMGTSMTLMLFARLLQGFSWNIPSNQVNIDLSEAQNSLALNNPLVASAIPRLSKQVYYA